MFLKSKIDLDIEKLDYSELDITIQKAKNDTYLRAHDIFSELTKDFTTMHSFANFSFKKDNSNLDIRFDTYENLTKQSDRHEHCFS